MEKWDFLQFLLYYCMYYYLFGSDTDAYTPEQIHISWGDSPLEVVVTWSTRVETPHVFVWYGIGVLNNIQSGETKIFIDGGKQKRKQYIHKAHLRNLEPSQKYKYVCGSSLATSKELWFRTVPDGNDWSPKLAIYGDMGVKNDVSLPYLIEDAQKALYDAFIHVGDFAYDMKNRNGRRGDEFLRNIQPIAAHVPYMVCPGNHEQAYNFSHFRERFNMPGSSENLFYSFNVGPAHFISINTEAFFYLEYGIKLLTKMVDWLEQDLLHANTPENRKIRPWVITYGHRPMYCSNTNHGCESDNSAVRVGLEGKWLGLEDMFYHHGVDLSFWGHEHSYERMLPLYNKTLRLGSVEHPYVDPKGPVHVTTGSAGCWEEIANFTDNPPPWSAKRLQLYGYSVLHIVNATHLNVQQIAVTKGKEVVDDFWIIKNNRRYSENQTSVDL